MPLLVAAKELFDLLTSLAAASVVVVLGGWPVGWQWAHHTEDFTVTGGALSVTRSIAGLYSRI